MTSLVAQRTIFQTADMLLDGSFKIPKVLRDIVKDYYVFDLTEFCKSVLADKINCETIRLNPVSINPLQGICVRPYWTKERIVVLQINCPYHLFVEELRRLWSAMPSQPIVS